MTEIALPWFFARPAADGPWPGVVVIQEANGVTAQLLRFCQRLAAEGYAVLAPDLYWRHGGTEASDYTTLVGTVVEDELRADLTESVRRLQELGAAKVGITGFCMGGTYAYRAALWDVGVSCAAGFYGSGIAQMLGEPACPVLLFFGGQDVWVPLADAEATRAHHGDDVVIYPEAGHGFMRDLSDDWHQASADDAWGRLLSFFAEHLNT
jgi:carboxymethylenebutenolidase